MNEVVIPPRERMIVFGDLHLNNVALQAILGFARLERIRIAFNLGDEGMLAPSSLEQQRLTSIYEQLNEFSNDPQNRLICFSTDKTVLLPRKLVRNYVNLEDDEKGVRFKNRIFHQDNIIAVHDGGDLIRNEEYNGYISSYSGDKPLLIFHGHSHSMGVRPHYKWLEDHEFIKYLGNGKRTYKLKPGKVYWVNPGTNNFQREDGKRAANMAVYNPRNFELFLKTVFIADV